MNNTTGFSEQEINSTIETFNKDSQKVLDEVKKQFDNVIWAISDNWGTSDAKKWAEEELIPTLTKTADEISNAILEIGKTIKTTGERQAEETHNKVSLAMPTKATMDALTNRVNEILSNGYVGVYDSLQSDVNMALEYLVAEVDKDLGTLQTHVYDNCKRSFTDQGTSKVADTANTYVEQVKSAINAARQKLNESIAEATEGATTYAKNIQDAGLQQAAAGN